VMSTFFYLSNPNSVVLVFTRKNVNNSLLWKISFFKITHDIISSNLVLIILTLYRFSMLTVLNVRKLLKCFKLCNFALVEINQFYLARNVDGNAE